MYLFPPRYIIVAVVVVVVYVMGVEIKYYSVFFSSFILVSVAYCYLNRKLLTF